MLLPIIPIWSPGGETTQDITGLSTGTYCVTVTDDNGCSETTCWAVGGPSLTGVTITDALCYNSCDGFIDVSVSGTATPYNYLWNPNGQVTQQAIGLCPGNYSLSITDSNSCSFFIDTFNVSAPDTMQVSFDTTSATCNLTPCNGLITANPFGGTTPYFYQWSNALETEQTITGVCAGVHPVSISDNNGCGEVFLAGLSDIGGVDSLGIITTNVTCFNGNDGSISVTTVYGGASPYSYNWTPATGTSNSITGLSAGVEFIEVTDNNNCVLLDFVNITSPSAISDSTIVTPTTCGNSNGEIAIYPTGGGGSPYTFVWSSGTPSSTPTSSTVTGLAPTNLVITINDNSGCSEEFTFNVNPSEFVISIDSLTDVTCNGLSDGYASVAISGGETPYAYLWSTGQNTAENTGIPAGNFNVTITDNTGCSATETVSIEQPAPLVQSALTTINILCNGSSDGTAVVDFIGGTLPYTFDWPNNVSGQTLSGLAAGTQTVTVTDDNNCIAESTITISEPPLLIIDTANLEAPLCASINNGEIEIVASGGVSGYLYEWPTDANSTTSAATGLHAGSYCMTVTDANNCNAQFCVTLADSISIIIDSIPNFSVCLADDSLTLVGNGTVNPSSNVLSYAWADEFGDTLGNNDSIAIIYSLSSSLETFTFITYITDNNGCFVTQAISVTGNDDPDIDAGEDIFMIVNSVNQLGGSPTSASGTSFIWSPNTFIDDSTVANPTYTPDVDGEFLFNLTVTDDNGCSAVDSINIVVAPVFKIVNIFSPNGDNINDEWLIPYLEQYPEADLWIYNRWGELIFKSIGGYDTPWNGTFNNKPVPVGSYYYVIELNHPDIEEPITGPLSVIR